MRSNKFNRGTRFILLNILATGLVACGSSGGGSSSEGGGDDASGDDAISTAKFIETGYDIAKIKVLDSSPETLTIDVRVADENGDTVDTAFTVTSAGNA